VEYFSLKNFKLNGNKVRDKIIHYNSFCRMRDECYYRLHSGKEGIKEGITYLLTYLLTHSMLQDII
jgi:hypothetical protein